VLHEEHASDPGSDEKRKSPEIKLGRNPRPFVEDSSSPSPFDSIPGLGRGLMLRIPPHRLAPQVPQAKSAKPEQFVDLSFLDEVEKEGFFTEMATRDPSK